MTKDTDEKLRAVFFGTAAGRRYVARAYSSAGPGWGVFDTVADRYVTDGELSKLSIKAIKEAKAGH